MARLAFIAYLLLALHYAMANQPIQLSLPPPIQIISGAYIKELPNLIPYEGVIPIIYKMQITPPHIHHFEGMINYGCDNETSDPKNSICKIHNFAVEQLLAISDKIQIQEQYLTMTASHSRPTSFQSNDEAMYLRDTASLPELTRRPIKRFGLEIRSHEMSNEATVDNDDVEIIGP